TGSIYRAIWTEKSIGFVNNMVALHMTPAVSTSSW
uniref:Uncharacterized protein n=1 Tax=Aegilops tauschii subsp. strangulata TaxID=200361 RepID=A0A453LXC4_AEGTS